MLGVRIRALFGRSWAILLVELAVLAVLAAGAAAVIWWPNDDPKPPATAAVPTPLDLPKVDSTAPVLMPGSPGEPAKTAQANEVSPLPRPPHNAADIRFVTMMIPHHEQALVMAKLVADRGENPKLKLIAERILVAQEPELKTMDTWLFDRGLDRNSGGNHGHTMRGMQSAEALNALTAARGAAFDKMFVDMMTDHHEGAIEMAEAALGYGSDVIINEMATSVIAEQRVEINRMREVLAGTAE